MMVYAARLAAALVALTCFGGGAAAQILGPGFGVSGYQVTSLATAGTASASESDSFVGASAGSLVDVSPFSYAYASASGLDLHGNALACCAGAGEAGAGASGKVLYSLVGGAPGEIYDLTFDFLSVTNIAAVGVTGGDAIAIANYGAIIASDQGFIQVSPGGEFESLNGGALASSNLHGFSSVDQATSQNSDLLTATFTTSLEASSYVLLADSLGVNDSTDAGEIHADETLSLVAVTVPRGVLGVLPQLVGPGGSVIDVTLAIPEPDTWLLLMFGLGCVGAAARRRRTLPPESAMVNSWRVID